MGEVFRGTTIFARWTPICCNRRKSEVPNAPCIKRSAPAVRDGPGADGFKLQCASDATAAHGVHLAGRFDDSGSGRIDWLNFGSAGQVRDVLFERGVGPAGGLGVHAARGSMKRKGLEARLPDGRALESIEIRWPAETPEAKRSARIEARVEVIVRDDFALARQAVDRLLAKQPALFDKAPLARASLMRALFSELGMAERSWCCRR